MVVAIDKGKKELEIPGKNRLRIAQIIKRGIQLKKSMEGVRQNIEKNNQSLIPHAENLAEKTGLKSAVFKGIEGTVTVKFTETIRYEEKDIGTVKEILGPIFTQMFHEIPSFAVNPENIPEIKKLLGKNFDRLVHIQATCKHTKALIDILSDGDSEVSRKLRDFVFIEPRKPSVSYDPVTE